MENCFAESIKNIHITDLLKHFIKLSQNKSPVRKNAHKYRLKKRDFINKSFLAMKNAGIVT